MIRLALRLLVVGGRRAALVHGVTILAVAAATAMALFAIAVPGALQSRADRTAWLDQRNVTTAPEAESGRPTTRLSAPTTFCACGYITTVWVEASGPDAPVVPGLSRNPVPGEVFVSPALKRLLRSEPVLADRYAPVSGLVAAGALSGPEDLLVVRSLDGAQMDKTLPEEVVAFAQGGDLRQYEPGTISLLVGVGAVTVLAPVVLLLVVTARAAAAIRRREVALLRLAGATRGQVTTMAAYQASALAAVGVACGAGLHVVLRPAAALVDPGGNPWFPSDMAAPSWAYAVVSVVIVAMVIAISLAGLRRAGTHPLEAASAARRPSALRLRISAAAVILVGTVGLVGVGTVAGVGRARLFAVLVVGLVAVLGLVGDVSVRVLGAALGAAAGPVRLLAARRITDEPVAVFSAVAGVVLAVVAATLFTASTPSALASFDDRRSTSLGTGAASADQLSMSPEVTEQLVEDLRFTPGISAVSTVVEGQVQTSTGPQAAWIGNCAEAITYLDAPGATCAPQGGVASGELLSELGESGGAVTITGLLPVGSASVFDIEGEPPSVTTTDVALTEFDPGTGWLAPVAVISPVAVPAESLTAVRPNRLLVRYDSPAGLERARTALQRVDPFAQLISQREIVRGNTAGSRRTHVALGLATAGAFAVAGASLGIFSLLGLVQRRRQLRALRAVGMTVSALRAVILLEALVPLAAAAALGMTVGLVAAAQAGAPALEEGIGFVAALTWPLGGGTLLALLAMAPAVASVRRFSQPANLEDG